MRSIFCDLWCNTHLLLPPVAQAIAIIRMMTSTLGMPRNPYFLTKSLTVRGSEISKKIQLAIFTFDTVEVVVFLFVCVRFLSVVIGCMAGAL